ncbi:MAG: ABC transporter substrate-binding protein [Ferruginibacter sp.]
MKIGILFPLSKVYPGVGTGFMDGLQSYLRLKGIETAFSMNKEGIGFGADEKDIFKKAEKLLISDDVDVLVAYLDEKVLYLIYPLVQATGKLMIVVNPGANYPLQWIPQPTVVKLNLQHAFLCWMSGALAAKKKAAQAALATTYYDCGYLHAAAIVNKFMEEGGVLKYNYINNQFYDANFEINALLNFLDQDPGCENLLCIFDEQPALLFYKLLSAYKRSNPLQLFVSPMMIQQKAKDKTGMAFPFTISGYLPWYEGIANDANKLFLGSCSKAVSIFSLLGWEAGMVLAMIYTNSEKEAANGEAVVASLLNNTIESPRGSLKLDPETLFYVAPVYKYELNEGTTEAEITKIEDPSEQWRSFTSKPTEGHVTGWMNTYLCY